MRRQSEHLADYALVLQRLIDRGLLYRCFRTRRELMAAALAAPHGAEAPAAGGPLPQAEERARVDAGEAYAWRLSLAAARAALGPRSERLSFEADGVATRAEPERLGDVVLARKDVPTSYHLASVHDDALAGVTDVIRGEDLREAAHLHVLLQALLDLPTPRYRHHRLILGPDGQRLAKRDRAATLSALRQEGWSAGDVRQAVGL